MLKRSPRKRQHGQTLIEIIIATTVVGIVMTSVVAVITVSVRNAARAKAKALGTKYTQEGIEYFRAQRNLMGWESFYGYLNTRDPRYCLDSLSYAQNGGLEQIPNRPCQSSEFVDERNIYTRQATITIQTINGKPTVNVLVTTSWPDGSTTITSEATAEFQQSEN